MKLTAQVKLLPDADQARALKQTLKTANAACDWISQQAWQAETFRQFPLHRLTYYAVREKFGLSAQLTVRCISKVADAYKIDRKTQREFHEHGAIAYDGRLLSFKLDSPSTGHCAGCVSIWTVAGRQTIPVVCGERQVALLRTQRGEADLCLTRGKFYLLVTCDVAAPQPLASEAVLGVDLGIVNIAADSDGETYSGADVERRRRIYADRRRNLQKKGTKSAKRKLKQLSGRQARFQKHTNHTISKRLVQKAQGSGRGLALEDLGGIRDRVTVRRQQRARHANWSFYQLRAFLTYKAALAGVPLVVVDPRNTSRTCPVCACVDKANRVSQSLFSCVSCGYSAPADTVAAWNIQARAAVNQPMVSLHLEQGQSRLL